MDFNFDFTTHQVTIFTGGRVEKTCQSFFQLDKKNEIVEKNIIHNHEKDSTNLLKEGKK